MASLALNLPYRAISPWMEMGAYEFLWTQAGQSFKRMAEKLQVAESRPSDFVLPEIAEGCAKEATRILRTAKVEDFGIRDARLSRETS